MPEVELYIATAVRYDNPDRVMVSDYGNALHLEDSWERGARCIHLSPTFSVR